MTSQTGGSSNLKSRRATYVNRIQSLETALNGHAQALPGISGAEFTDKLFARASFRFLEEKSTEILSSITHHALEALLSVVQDPSIIHMKRWAFDDHPALIICKKDRPFIVSTIAEVANRKGIAIRTLLHPIYSIQDQQYSLCFVEFAQGATRAWEDFCDELNSVLLDLDIICSDFGTMKGAIQDRALQSQGEHFLKTFKNSDNKDVASLLHWILEGSFIIIGSLDWAVEADALTPLSSGLGLFRSTSYRQHILFHEVLADVGKLFQRQEPIWITHLSVTCPIHRQTPLVHIFIPTVNGDGKIVGMFSLVGIFTSKALSEPSSNIPLIRQKLTKIVEMIEVQKDSHDHKFVVDMIDRMPKEEIVRLDTEELYQFIEKTIDVFNRNDVRLILNPDPSDRAASVVIIMPRERFNTAVRQRIQSTLEELLGAASGTSEYYVDLSAHEIARLYFYIPCSIGEAIDPKILEDAVYGISRTWYEQLTAKVEEIEGGALPFLRQRYQFAFSSEYQASTPVHIAYQDISAIESMVISNPLRVILGQTTHPDGLDSVFIYHLRTPLTLSKALPVLEHAGFEVHSEETSVISPLDVPPVYVHRFLVKPRVEISLTPEQFTGTTGPGLENVLSERADNDSLNSLLITTTLTPRSISLLRTYSSLLWQMGGVPRKHLVREALGDAPELAHQLWNLFSVKFNPGLSLTISERTEQFQQGKARFEERLKSVRDIQTDRLFRSLITLIEHTVRTNYFIQSDAIALKLHTEKIEFAPAPRPMYEVFVHSYQLEGTHLRSGLVSRGGLRWSVRPDDFRTEVLGLVKTQKIKNVFIVPTGAKGGFVVRHPAKEPDKVPAQVQAMYEQFIRALLSIADNRIDGVVEHPKDIVCYDGDDPYFVVAADRGTATFSDLANQIARDEKDFWLDDAFASGGSNGYDHKLYGITARGAWESVVRHFNDTGIDFKQTPFTAVGIGDMAGDVFGNGLLLSDQVKLVGAFNHKHIFVDPNPDVGRSFQERKRLFELPRSQWSDYSKDVLSEGGAIYDRSAKEIVLSPATRLALGIGSEVPECISGEELISHILKAPVDLMWNGGIGTYVKASFETHVQANDSTNDRVRVNADELRCKVVSEGGNLGFTQLARIEYARHGGLVNTDAIDNSGGVGLSDLEVNIKILFSQLMKQSKVSLDERNVLLKEMAEAVCGEVLLHNKDHAYTLTSSSKRSVDEIEYYKSLINYIVRLGLTQRRLDALPDEEELTKRASQKIGVFRPELAVVLAYVKIWIKNVILDSNIPSEESLENLLLTYFPEILKERFSDAIVRHPLARNIIATQATNILVNQLGITFIHRLCIDHAVDPVLAIRSALAALQLLNTKGLSQELWKLDTKLTQQQFVELRELIKSGTRDLTAWLVQNHPSVQKIDDLINLYKASFDKVFESPATTQSPKVRSYIAMGISKEAAHTLVFLPHVLTSCEIMNTSRRCDKSFDIVESAYSTVAQTLRLAAIPKLLENLEPKNKWEATLLVGSLSEIRRGIAEITLRLLKHNVASESAIKAALSCSPSYKPLIDAVNEVENLPATVAHLAVLAKLVNGFVITVS